MSTAIDANSDLAALRELLIGLVESQSGEPLPEGQEWLNDRQWLAKKFLFHLVSLERLGEGATVTISGVQHFHFDHSSIAAIARSVTENFLVFAWIFGASEFEVARFRNLVWRQSGLNDRVKRVATTAESKKKQESDKLEMAELRKQIVAHPQYGLLNKKRRETLFEDWKRNRSWQSLAEAAGLYSTYFRNVYSYLSDHAHPSYAGALQVGQADQAAQRDMARSIVGIVCLISAHFIRAYMRDVAKAQTVLQASSAKTAYERWLIEPKHLMEFYEGKSAQ